MTAMNKMNDEKPIFSEIFYRSEKKFIERKMRELVRDISLMLFGGILGTSGLIWALWVSGTILNLISILLISGCFVWILWII